MDLFHIRKIIGPFMFQPSKKFWNYNYNLPNQRINNQRIDQSTNQPIIQIGSIQLNATMIPACPLF